MTDIKLENLELLKLKEYGWDLPQEVVDSFKLLPLDTFRNDLISIIRYYIDNQIIIEEDIDYEDLLPVHAVFLMAHFRIEEGLEVILEFWSLDKDYIEVFFGDIIDEEGWYVIYHLGQNQLDLIIKFILSKADTFCKIEASTALSILARKKTELRDKISVSFDKVLSNFINLSYETDLIDETLVAFVVLNVVESEFQNLDSKVRELFDKGFVDLTVIGSYEEMHAHFKEYGPEERGDFNRTIVEIYKYFDCLFSKEFLNNEDIDYSGFLSSSSSSSSGHQKSSSPAISSNVIGRNDPCPCGSGKKYKKCCGD